jgi:hypothetical protein
MDIKRAVYAVRSSGVEIARVEIEPGSGKITVVAGRAVDPDPVDPNPFDALHETPKVALRP